MNKVEKNGFGVDADLRLVVYTLDFMFKTRASVEQMEKLLNMLFYALGDSSNRNFTLDGMVRFKEDFDKYKNEYKELVGYEELEDFNDKLYMFMDECFPLSESSN